MKHLLTILLLVLFTTVFAQEVSQTRQLGEAALQDIKIFATCQVVARETGDDEMLQHYVYFANTIAEMITPIIAQDINKSAEDVYSGLKQIFHEDAETSLHSWNRTTETSRNEAIELCENILASISPIFGPAPTSEEEKIEQNNRLIEAYKAENRVLEEDTTP